MLRANDLKPENNFQVYQEAQKAGKLGKPVHKVRAEAEEKRIFLFCHKHMQLNCYECSIVCPNDWKKCNEKDKLVKTAQDKSDYQENISGISVDCKVQNGKDCHGIYHISPLSPQTVKCSVCNRPLTFGKPLLTKPEAKFRADDMLFFGNRVTIVASVMQGSWFGLSPWWLRFKDWYNFRPECDAVKLKPLQSYKDALWIYNPTYGSLQIKSTKKTLEESSHYVQSEVAWDRLLKASELKELTKKGNFGYYPDEWYIVDSKHLRETDALTHFRQVAAFEETDRHHSPKVPKVYWKDSCGNEMAELTVHSVPGPEVDLINALPVTEAVEMMKQSLIHQTARTYRTEHFQDCAAKHAWDLVMAVTKITAYPTMKGLPWAQKIAAKIDWNQYDKQQEEIEDDEEEQNPKSKHKKQKETSKGLPQRSLFDFQ